MTMSRSAKIAGFHAAADAAGLRAGDQWCSMADR